MAIKNLQLNNMKIINPLNVALAVRELGNPPSNEFAQFVWAHGWMQSHHSLIHLAHSFEKFGTHLLFDFPGFGLSPKPPGSWGTRDYAEHLGSWLQQVKYKKRIWIGHSFGCRVGIQLAAFNPQLIDGLFLISAAGISGKKSLRKTLKVKSKVYTYKFLKKLIPFGIDEKWLNNYFGSQDYRNAGDLRPIFLKVVTENLMDVANKVTCPVFLIYGENDSETPPEIGQCFADIIPQSSLFVLPGYDHFNILTKGRNQLLHHLNKLLESIN